MPETYTNRRPFAVEARLPNGETVRLEPGESVSTASDDHTPAPAALGTISEVLETVGTDPGLAVAVIDQERAQKNRPSLIAQLEQIVADAGAADDQADTAD